MGRLRRSGIQQVANCIRLYQFLVSRHKDLAGATETEETHNFVLTQFDFEGPGHAGTVFR